MTFKLADKVYLSVFIKDEDGHLVDVCCKSQKQR